MYLAVEKCCHYFNYVVSNEGILLNAAPSFYIPGGYMYLHTS